jgi:LacI family transcriptional regulator
MDVARQMVEYLTGLGHARIGYIGGPDHIASHRGRWLAFQDVTGQMAVLPGEQQVVRGAGWRLTENEQALIIRMLSGPKRPTAVVAAGYDFALNALAAASVAGLKVPEDLSIVAIDDPPSAAHLNPGLTTIRQPLLQLGQAAATQLCEYLSCNGNGQPLADRILRAELIVRRSAGPIARKA